MEKSRCQIREEDEKFSSLIGVSDDVVKRLSGEEEEASESHSGMWEGGGELDAVYLKGLDEFWVKRLACMETTHTSRNRFTEDEFYKARIVRVESLGTSPTQWSGTDWEGIVTRYQPNPMVRHVS
uniref:(California timema) hypothetical protein n=1 Tax=Timema californicum TaxID=61474 RepID=A0A7R9JFE2_TIMCA|nr:unnamed protein product [Timema californicum]